MAEARVERRLAAILAADVVGYSRLMRTDEVGTLASLRLVRNQIFDPAIAIHNGRIFKTTGDGLLAEFASAVDAVTCAMTVQTKMATSESSAIRFRIGINIGDIIIDGDDVLGDGVNVAARVENECESGGVYLSDDAFRQVRGKTAFIFDDLGEKPLKNIDRPVRIFAARVERRTPATAPAVGTLHPDNKYPELPDKPSIAVLPFQNMSGDSEQDYFADGMVEEIITALSRFKSLFVIARNSSFTYKGQAVDIKRVGRELGVRYVLEGSVRKSANRVRITGQLIDAATGAHLWADRIDGGLGDVFDLQDQVTESIVGAIAPAVEKAEIERAKRKPADSLDAYDHYLRGIASAYRFGNQQANDEALRLFNRAIELDPGFAPAYGLAAVCYTWAKTNGWMSVTPNDIEKVRRLVRHAIELGKDDVITLAASGYALAFIARELPVGAAIVDRALVLNSNLAEAWYWGGWMKNWLGEPEAAIDRFARAIRLNPLDPSINGVRAGISHAHYFLGRYDDSASWASVALQDNPDFQPALRMETASNAMAGRLEEASQALERLRQLNPQLRVSNLKDMLGPYRRAEDVVGYQEGLRRAGLPE